MSDRAIENANAKRNQLLARKREILNEISDIDDSINRIDQFIRDYRLFAGDEEIQNHPSPTQDVHGESESPAPRSPKATGNPKKEDVAEAAREIIAERGEPIMRDELYDLLAARGINIQGKDPRMVLSTMLWRMKDRVVRLEAGGYWLREVPYKKSGYDPSYDEDDFMNTSDPSEPPTPDDYEDD